MKFLFAMAPATLHVVAVIGGATALFAATIALTQNDIKKVLAYSTVSQLGYMFIGDGRRRLCCGGIFHLMTHAFFKACLFLGAGSVIHAMHHEQDMRKMGGLKKYMPLHVHHVFYFGARDSGLSAFCRIFLERRNPLGGVPRTSTGALVFRRLRRRHDRFLHVPPGVHDVLRRVPRRPSHPGPSARVARRYDYAAGDFRHRRCIRRIPRIARRPGSESSLSNGSSRCSHAPRSGARIPRP